MAEISDRVCPECGAPATRACVDIIERVEPGAQFVVCHPTGPIKLGCNQHPPVCSVEREELEA